MGRMRKRVILIISVVVICIISLIIYNESVKRKSDIQSGGISINVVEGTSPESTQEELNRRVEEGMFRVFINTNIVLDNGESKANLLIENNESNHNSCIVRIETQEGLLLYTSDEIPTGYKIEQAQLAEDLEPGKYDCVAHFDILNTSGNVTNTINVNVKVTVIN